MSSGGFGDIVSGIGNMFGGGSAAAPTPSLGGSSGFGSFLDGGASSLSDFGGFSGSAAAPDYFGGAAGGLSNAAGGFGGFDGFGNAASSVLGGYGNMAGYGGALQQAANTALAGSQAGGGFMDTLSKFLPSAGVTNLGMGALGMYNNYQAQKQQQAMLDKATQGLTANANAASNFAVPMLQSGGALTSIQQANVDSQMQQMLDQGIAQIYQNAVNAGLDPNSLMVQQQIQQLKTQINTQQNALTQQYQQQNLQEAFQGLGLSGQSYSGLLGAGGPAVQQASQTSQSIMDTLAQLEALSNGAQ